MTVPSFVHTETIFTLLYQRCSQYKYLHVSLCRIWSGVYRRFLLSFQLTGDICSSRCEERTINNIFKKVKVKFSPEVPVWSGPGWWRWTGCAAAHDTGCTRWTGTSRRLRRRTPWCWSPSETDAPGPTDRRTAGVWVFQVICRWDCSDLISVHLSASVHSYINLRLSDHLWSDVTPCLSISETDSMFLLKDRKKFM